MLRIYHVLPKYILSPHMERLNDRHLSKDKKIHTCALTTYKIVCSSVRECICDL